MAAPLLSTFMWIFCFFLLISFTLYYVFLADTLFKHKKVKKILYFTIGGILIFLQLLAVIYASAHLNIVNKADLQLSELSVSTKECADEYMQIDYDKIGKVLSKSRTFGGVALGFSIFHIAVEVVLMLFTACFIFRKKGLNKIKEINQKHGFKKGIAFTVWKKPQNFTKSNSVKRQKEVKDNQVVRFPRKVYHSDNKKKYLTKFMIQTLNNPIP